MIVGVSPKPDRETRIWVSGLHWGSDPKERSESEVDLGKGGKPVKDVLVSELAPGQWLGFTGEPLERLCVL